MSKDERQVWEERYASGTYRTRPWASDLLEMWVERMPRGRVLDVPCGAGRNALFLAENGFQVDAVDISASALEIGEAEAQRRRVKVRWSEVDLDVGEPPAPPYQLLVSCFYVNRALIPRMKSWVSDEGGFVVFEQHLETPLEVDGPHSPEWRMAPNELLDLFSDFRVLHYEEGVFRHERDGHSRVNALARLVACKGAPGY